MQRPCSVPRLAFNLSLLALDPVPQSLDLAGLELAGVAENVRMPANELFSKRLDDVAEIESAFLFGHARVEHDLEQEVAELVLEVVAVAARNRVGNLIGFLDGVGRDGREGLLEVPGASGARRAQPRHDLDQPADV